MYTEMRIYKSCLCFDSVSRNSRLSMLVLFLSISKYENVCVISVSIKNYMENTRFF